MANTQIIYSDEFDTELQFAFSRSSGPGGQHVNKVNTKVELRFNINQSKLLDFLQKEILWKKLKNILTQDGDLLVISQKTRSQLKNKEIAIEKFYKLLNDALKPIKKRKPTKPSRSAKEKRLKDKKALSEKKSRRKLEE